MKRFFWRTLPRLTMGAVVMVAGLEGSSGIAHEGTAVSNASPWTMSVKHVPEGYRFEAVSDGLRMTKMRKATGEMIISLTENADSLTLTLNRSAITVTVGARTLRLDPETPNAESIQSVQAVMKQSRLARRFEQRLQQTAPGGDKLLRSALATTRALLRSLQGDPSGARTALAQSIDNPSPWIVRIQTRRKCWDDYEQEVTRAANDLAACISEIPDWYKVLGGTQTCGFRWAIWVEGAWFEYLGCSALPLRL